MGVSIEHDFIYESECIRCGNQFGFTIRGYEYPLGAIDFDDCNAWGCDVRYSLSIDPDYFDFDIPEECEEWIADDITRLIEQIRINPSTIYRISDRRFEELVAEVFSRNGYIVELTPPQKDGGKDVIATKNISGVPICLYIECKHYNPDHSVGVNIVRSAAGVRQHDRVNKAIIITTSRFTRGAHRFAAEEEHLIQLMDLEDFLNLLKYT
ncbi:restriction endonuclease [Ruminococcus flavefaciens]|uniref:restriction endonuclease n=1 Tax=Ruminococcus flavefaciens TaxID=1265 RepID=UPI0006848072|nr:restriction endonuclease [Ruminococcus flavefaciens]